MFFQKKRHASKIYNSHIEILDFLQKNTSAGKKSGIFGRCVELCVSVQGAVQPKFDILGREILVGLKLISP